MEQCDETASGAGNQEVPSSLNLTSPTGSVSLNSTFWFCCLLHVDVTLYSLPSISVTNSLCFDWLKLLIRTLEDKKIHIWSLVIISIFFKILFISH